MEPLFWPRKTEPLFSPQKTERPIRNLRLRLSQGQLFWREVGRGQAIVFLHGSWCDGNQWLSLLPLLGGRYHCLAPDLMGWGESSRLKPSAYSIELEVDALAELLKGLRLTSVCLVGHSLGAWVATRYALKYPDQVHGLVVLEPEGFALPELKDRWRNCRWLLNPLVGLWLWASQPVMARLGQQTTWLRSHHQRQQLLRYTAACRLLFRRRRAALQAEQLTSPLDTLTTPLLILQSDQASPTSQLLSRAYAIATPQASLKTLPAADDLSAPEPNALAAEIDHFITTLAHPSAPSRASGLRNMS
jgi:pimeloyl-ACP methyl ester carboxylesterase